MIADLGYAPLVNHEDRIRATFGEPHHRLRLARRWPLADLITTAITRLRCCPHPDQHQPPRRHRKETTRARGTPPTQRDSWASALTGPQNNNRLGRYATQPTLRKIEVSHYESRTGKAPWLRNPG